MAPSDFDRVPSGPDPARSSGDELDVPLEDPVQMEEVELLSAVMIQAGTHDAPLDQSEVDRLLGVDDESRGGA